MTKLSVCLDFTTGLNFLTLISSSIYNHVSISIYLRENILCWYFVYKFFFSLDFMYYNEITYKTVLSLPCSNHKYNKKPQWARNHTFAHIIKLRQTINKGRPGSISSCSINWISLTNFKKTVKSLKTTTQQ